MRQHGLPVGGSRAFMRVASTLGHCGRGACPAQLCHPSSRAQSSCRRSNFLVPTYPPVWRTGRTGRWAGTRGSAPARVGRWRAGRGTGRRPCERDTASASPSILLCVQPLPVSAASLQRSCRMLKCAPSNRRQPWGTHRDELQPVRVGPQFILVVWVQVYARLPCLLPLLRDVGVLPGLVDDLWHAAAAAAAAGGGVAVHRRCRLAGCGRPVDLRRQRPPGVAVCRRGEQREPGPEE